MKKILMASLIAAATLAAFNYVANANPVMGQRVMSMGGELEARLRGLTEKTVNAAGIDHRLYQGGPADKPAVVLLHGYSADKDVWPRFASHLINDFHIVIPDMAGHGETGFKPDWNYSVPSQARRIVALMDALQIRQFHVVGNSMGGMITATLALEYPDRVLTATAIDPAGVGSPTPSRMDNMVAAGRNPFEVANYAQFREFYGMTMAKPPYLPEFVLKGIGQSYQDRRDELATIFRHIHRKDSLDKRLAEIKPPMLLVWGDRDELLDVSAAAVWQAGVPNLQTEILKDIGHMPMVEAPEQTATLVRSFLQKAR